MKTTSLVSAGSAAQLAAMERLVSEARAWAILYRSSAVLGLMVSA